MIFIMIELAHRYGLKAHYARCGTRRKIRRAVGIGADSGDSAFPLWIKDRLEAVISSLDNISTQGKLAGASHEG